MKYFYSHLLEIESVTEKIDDLDLTDEQKLHLASLVDATFHSTILELVLSKLSPSDKKAFITFLQEDSKAPKIMEFLNLKVDNIETEIKKAAEKIKKELHEDMEEAKREK